MANYRGHKIYGVATNDLKGQGILTSTLPSYPVWFNMIKRCYSPALREKSRCYRQVSVDPSWLLLSNFNSWAVSSGLCEANKNFIQLDKDLITLGSNLYSEHTCPLVPRKINNLLVDKFTTEERHLPIGVTWDKDWERYIAKVSTQTRTGQRTVRMGGYNDPLEAHFAWQKEKAAEIVRRVNWWKSESKENKHLLYNEKVAENLLARASLLLEHQRHKQEFLNQFEDQ